MRTGGNWHDCGGERWFWSAPGVAALGLGGGEQGAPGLIQVGEGEEQMQPGGILGEAAVAHAGVTPEALDDAEGKLNFGT